MFSQLIKIYGIDIPSLPSHLHFKMNMETVIHIQAFHYNYTIEITLFPIPASRRSIFNAGKGAEKKTAYIEMILIVYDMAKNIKEIFYVRQSFGIFYHSRFMTGKMIVKMMIIVMVLNFSVFGAQLMIDLCVWFLFIGFD